MRKLPGSLAAQSGLAIPALGQRGIHSGDTLLRVKVPPCYKAELSKDSGSSQRRGIASAKDSAVVVGGGVGTLQLP